MCDFVAFEGNMNNKYCYKLCENHPKTNDMYGREHTCINENDIKFWLKEEHKKGRPILKRIGCPFENR